MKKALKLVAGGFLLSLLFVQCGSNGSHRTINEYLGAVPSIEKEYAVQWQELETKRRATTTREESGRIREQLESLSAQWAESIENHLKENPLTRPLPFHVLTGSPYTINEIKVAGATRGRIELVLDVTLTDDILEENPFAWGGGATHRPSTNMRIYFKALDSQGNDIPHSLISATHTGREPLTKGINQKINATWSREAIVNLEDFASIVEVTEQEYKDAYNIL